MPLALPVLLLAAATLWAALLTGLLWRPLPWLRPVGGALLAQVAVTWVPGVGGDTLVLAVAVAAVLSVVQAEEIPGPLARRLLVAATAVAVTAVGLLSPAGPVVLAVAGPVDPVRRSDPLSTVPAAPRLRPLAIEIPALGVAGPLEELTVEPGTAELVAPADPARAGWFAAGVVPGDRGPAVVGGHVDSRDGPGVFAELATLDAGDRITVTRSDGSVVRFAVTTVRRHPKDRFPSAAVYGPAPGPELRLVTCGGRFDRSERSYQDNVVVEAVLV
jgi:hypothetical protein